MWIIANKLNEFLSIILYIFKTSESESLSVVSDSLQPHGLYSPWNSLGQNTGVGCLSLLQEIFPTQGSNPGLPHCRQILYQLSYQGAFPKSASDLTQGHFKLLSLSWVFGNVLFSMCPLRAKTVFYILWFSYMQVPLTFKVMLNVFFLV